VPGVDLIAVEIDSKLCALAANNAERNRVSKFRVVNADVTASGKSLRAAGLESETFDQVIANPPFYAEGRVRAAPDRARRAAHVMDAGALKDWVRFFAAMAAPRGTLTLIHRPECLAELLPLLEGRFGDVIVFPLYPKANDPALRIIVQAKKASRGAIRLMRGLVLHGEDGRYTEEAEAVLRGGEALDLDPARKLKGRRPGGMSGSPL
jgi:tRNA1(Val) A37 N6-methylase TrmN6